MLDLDTLPKETLTTVENGERFVREHHLFVDCPADLVVPVSGLGGGKHVPLRGIWFASPRDAETRSAGQTGARWTASIQARNRRWFIAGGADGLLLPRVEIPADGGIVAPGSE